MSNLLRRLKSLQLSTLPISKLENQSGIKLLEEVFMVQRGINVLLRDKFNQQLLYQLVKCAVWAEPQTSCCWGKSLSLCKLQDLYQSVSLPGLYLGCISPWDWASCVSFGWKYPKSGQVVAKGDFIRQNFVVCLAWEGRTHSGKGEVGSRTVPGASVRLESQPLIQAGCLWQEKRKNSTITLHWLSEVTPGLPSAAAPTRKPQVRASSGLCCSALLLRF